MGPAATAVAKVHIQKNTQLQNCLAPRCLSASLSFSFQNVYAVLDLYGRITAVSIVSSSLMEDMESVKAPSLSSESCSEGEEDSTPVREVGELECYSQHRKILCEKFRLFISPLAASRLRLSHVRWCPLSWRSWKTTARTSSCRTRTWQQPECLATTRACWSPPSHWLASSSSRCHMD